MHGQPAGVVFEVAVEFLHLAVGDQHELIRGAFDHMPPTVEYTTTTPPPSNTEIQKGRPNSTSSTVPMARIEDRKSVV